MDTKNVTLDCHVNNGNKPGVFHTVLGSYTDDTRGRKAYGGAKGRNSANAKSFGPGGRNANAPYKGSAALVTGRKAANANRFAMASGTKNLGSMKPNKNRKPANVKKPKK